MKNYSRWLRHLDMLKLGRKPLETSRWQKLESSSSDSAKARLSDLPEEHWPKLVPPLDRWPQSLAEKQ